MKKQENAKGAWNSASLIQKFTPPQQELFFGEIDKHVSRGWADSVPKGTNDAREVVLNNTTFGIVKEGKNTKVIPVNVCTGTNMRSPPATNSQLSTVEAVRLVRGNVQKGRAPARLGPGVHENPRQNRGRRRQKGHTETPHGARNTPHDLRARN